MALPTSLVKYQSPLGLACCHLLIGSPHLGAVHSSSYPSVRVLQCESCTTSARPAVSLGCASEGARLKGGICKFGANIWKVPTRAAGPATNRATLHGRLYIGRLYMAAWQLGQNGCGAIRVRHLWRHRVAQPKCRRALHSTFVHGVSSGEPSNEPSRQRKQQSTKHRSTQAKCVAVAVHIMLRSSQPQSSRLTMHTSGMPSTATMVCPWRRYTS